MKKKLILIGTIVVIAAICAICIISNIGKTNLDMDMVGAFVHADGTTEPVSFTIEGYAKERDDGNYALYIDIKYITAPENFRYDISASALKGPSFISFNREANYLPHLLICPSLDYDKQLDNFSISNFAIDLQKKCAIMLFGNSPDCYLVASEDGKQNHEQLLTHFADFIASSCPQFWD